MTIKKVFEKAIEGGFVEARGIFKLDGSINPLANYELFWLNPKFWQGLGKALGWEKGKVYTFVNKAREQTAVHRKGLVTFHVPQHTITRQGKPTPNRWIKEWKMLIDVLAQHKPAQSYFSKLK